ncbi:MAG: hypothetical protein ABW220_08810 [Burkholderiaceae bacterium]
MKKPARAASAGLLTVTRQYQAGQSSTMRGQRQSGPGGGTIGGPTGMGRGSPFGAGVCRLNGLMMIGGIAGGAEGGFLAPSPAWARPPWIP